MTYTVKANTEPFVTAIKSAQESLADAEKRLESSKKSAIDFKTQLSKVQQEQQAGNARITEQLTKIAQAESAITQATQSTKKIITETKDQLLVLNRLRAEGLSLASQGGAMGAAEKALLTQKITTTRLIINEEKAAFDKKKQDLQSELAASQKILKTEQSKFAEQTKISQNLNNALTLQLKAEEAITAEIRKQKEERAKASNNTTVLSATKAQTAVNYPDVKQGNFKLATQGVDNLGKAYTNTSKAQREFAATTEKSSQTLKNLINPMETVNRSLAGMVATYVSFSFVKNTTQDVLETSMQFDSLNKVFEAITGSMSGAERAMSLVQAEADRLGLPIMEAAKGLKGLQAAGMAAGIPLADLEEQFKAASQATTFFAMSTTESERVFKAWSQILSKDKLMAEELTQQLGDSLPGAISIMAKALGYVNKNGLPDTARLMKEMEKGAIDGSDAMEKFGKELLKITDKGVLTASQSAMREMNRMQNEMKLFKKEIGEAGLLDAATDVFKATADLLHGIKADDLREFGAVITDIIVPALQLYVAHLIVTSKAGKALIAGIAPMITTQNTLAKATVASAAAQEKAIFAEKARTGGLHGLSLATTQATLTTEKQTLQQKALSAAIITNNAGATEFSRRQYAMAAASGVATKAAGGLTAGLKLALPFLLVEGVIVAWSLVADEIRDVQQEILDLADGANLTGLTQQIIQLQKALNPDKTSWEQFTGKAKEQIAVFAGFLEGNSAATTIADREKKKLENLNLAYNLTYNQHKDVMRNVDTAGANAEDALKKTVKLYTSIQDKSGNIRDKDFQKVLQDDIVSLSIQTEKYNAVKNKGNKTSSSKGGKAPKEPKDTTNDEIATLKKQLELQSKLIENELVMGNMRGEFGKDELEYYKELNTAAQKQNEIQAELEILISKKPKKGEEAAAQEKINGLVEEYKLIADSIGQIHTKNIITNKEAVKAIEEMEIAGYKVYEYGKERNEIDKEHKTLLKQNATIESQTAAQKHKDNRLAFLALKTEHQANKSKLDLAKDIADVVVEGNQKQRTLEELRHKDAIGNLEYEIATASEQDATRIEQLRIRIALENEIYKQNTSSLLKYINAGFDALEKGIDDTLFDVLTGKFENFGESLVDMFEDFGTQIGRELTASLASEITGFSKGGVKDLLGLGTDSSLTGYLSGASSIGTGGNLSPDALAELIAGGATVTADNTLITAGGTEVNASTGTILKKGDDIAQLAESMGKGAQSLLSVGSNLQTLATLPQKLNSIVSFVSNPSGYFSAMSGGSMLGVAGQGFGGFLSGGSAASGFSLANGSAAYNAGYYGGGALAGAAGGYATGLIGDRIFGAQTQASNFGAIGGAIGSLGGLPGMAVGIAIGSLIGGAIGTKKEDNRAIDIFKASSEGVAGQDRVTYKTKSWYGVKTDVSTQTFDEATAKSIEKVIESYDHMLQQLGDTDRIVVENKAFESITDFVDKGITEAFLAALGQTNVEGIYTSWKTYAEGIDKSVNEAFTVAIASFIKTKQEFDIWALQFGGDELGALKKRSELATKELEILANALGIGGVTIDTFGQAVDDLIKDGFTPEAIQNVENLSTSLRTAEEAQKAYKTAVDNINLSIDTIVMSSKGYDLAMLNNIKTIENLTGITMNSISDIESVANSLKGIPNITTDAINAFSSLSNSIIAMKNKVEGSVKSSIASVMPETVDIKADYLKFFDIVPTTLEDWRKQGEALISSIQGDVSSVKTQPVMSEESLLTLLQSLIPNTDKEVANIIIPKVETGEISIPMIDKVLNYVSGTAESFLKEHGGYTPKVPINITDEQLRIYNAYGETLKATTTAVQATTPAFENTTTAAQDTTTAFEDLADKLNYTSKFIKTYKEWLVDGDDTKTLELSKQAFDDLQSQIGISGVKVETFLGQFGEALKGGLTDDSLNLWEDMGGALMDFVDGLKDLRDTWQDMATSFGNAADDIRGKTTKSFAEIRAMAPTTDNYQDLISMLNDSRQKEIDNLNKASQIRIDALAKEKALFLDLSQIIKSINARIIDIAPANNRYYGSELSRIKGAISRGEQVDTSGLSSSVSTYLDKYKTQSATKEDYIRESARVREEIAGVQGHNTTLTDIEKAIKNEELALKTAIDNVNNSAIAILNGWREFSFENTNRIVEAILSLKVPVLATYQPPTQPIGAAGTTPRPLTTNEFSSMPSNGDVRTTRDIVKAGLTAALGSTPSDAIIDVWTAKAEATSLSAIGVPENIINGSYATGINRVPTDRISQIHKDEAVLNRGDAEEWRDLKSSGGSYGGTNTELLGVMKEMANTMREMATELVRTKEEIKEMRAILRKVNQKGDGFNVYPVAV